MKFRTNKPFWYGGVYTPADVSNPVDFELGKDCIPSKFWEPLDKEAEAAILRVINKEHVKPDPVRQFNKIHVPETGPKTLLEKTRALEEFNAEKAPEIKTTPSKKTRSSDTEI